MLPAAVCKLPPALIPALACSMCEQMASPEAQERLKQEAQDERSITGLIALYLSEDVGRPTRALSKALLSPPLLDWAQLELVAMVTPPSRSAAAAQQRASAAAPASLHPAELLRALRIVAWNASLYGADRRDVQRTRDRSLQHQTLVLGSWKGQYVAQGRTAAKGNVNMVLGMAAFSATAVFAVLCEAGPRDDVVGALLRNARIFITEMDELRLEHRKRQLLATVHTPAAPDACYCLAQTISKLVGQHNLSWYPDGRDLSGSSIANSGAAQRRCCCCGSSSCVAPDTCSSQECFEACATVFTNLRAHIAQDADPASNKHGQTKGASLTMSAAAGCEIQATRTSVLWILFRTCLRLSSWLVTSHNTWLGMRDPVWLPPGTSLPFSLQPASKRQSLRETQLKALRRPTVEQAHQLPAAAQLPVPGARIFTLAGKKKREHCAGRLLTGAPAGVWCSCTVHGMFTAWLC
ncbi:MAG: hypothetical protein WDW38_008480 [Sanguina aurantia]